MDSIWLVVASLFEGNWWFDYLMVEMCLVLLAIICVISLSFFDIVLNLLACLLEDISREIMYLYLYLLYLYTYLTEIQHFSFT